MSIYSQLPKWGWLGQDRATGLGHQDFCPKLESTAYLILIVSSIPSWVSGSHWHKPDEGDKPHLGPITYLITNGETEAQRGRANPQAQLGVAESWV